MSLLEVSGLTKRFGGLVANQDISFSLERGEIVGLIGPNGAGKTTVFNCIAGFLPATAGTIRFDGALMSADPERCARAGIGRTFQIARTFASLTALENVMVGALLHARRLAPARAKAHAMLELVDLERVAARPAGTLTISEQRRLAVARALATDPKLLLMDEVMAGLTPTEVHEAVAVVKQVQALGIACLVVEHVLEGIMPIADRVVVLDFGRKIADAPPAAVSADAAVIAAYLGGP